MTNIDEISRVLGRLEEGLKQLKDNADVATAQRAEIAVRLAGIEGVSARVTNLERRTDSQDRAIAVHEQWRQRGIGIFMFLAAICGVIGATITAVVGHFMGRA